MTADGVSAADPRSADDAVRITLAQLALEGGRVRENVDHAVAAVERAAADGADLVVLPELFTVGYFAFDSYAREAEGLDGPTLTRLAALAADLGVAIQAGSVVEDLAASNEAGYDVPESDGLANTAVFIGRTGDYRAVYRKQHLFGYAASETDLFTAGEALRTVEFEGFTVGMTTCYDLRFPELYRRLVDRGVSLVLVPSAWPYPRVEHWRTLPRARAIENQTYVATANAAGTVGDETFLGRSTIYDPEGVSLASAGDDPALVRATISPTRVRDTRDAFPSLQHR